jgi:hypothetical protein
MMGGNYCNDRRKLQTREYDGRKVAGAEGE